MMGYMRLLGHDKSKLGFVHAPLENEQQPNKLAIKLTYRGMKHFATNTRW